MASVTPDLRLGGGDGKKRGRGREGDEKREWDRRGGNERESKGRGRKEERTENGRKEEILLLASTYTLCIGYNMVYS